MEVKQKNLVITVAKCKKTPDIAVIMGIPFECDYASLQKLNESFAFDNVKHNPLYTGAEASALAYALYQVVRDKFVGSPLDLARTRVSRIDFDSHGGKFILSWNTQGSLSMLRKTLGLALSVMNPHKLYAKYSTNIKNLGGRADRGVFEWVADRMAEAIKKSIKVAVVGKINIDNTKLKVMASTVEKKLPKLTMARGTKPEAHKAFCHEFPSIKASGLTAVAVADYLRSNGMGVAALGGEIIVYNKSFPSKRAALKKADRIKNYVRQKYEKLGDDFSCILAYLTITQSLGDCCTATSIIKSKPKPKDMVALIQKGL